MKRFQFRLERVLGWRRTQARLEEMKLEGLHAARRTLEDRLKLLQEQRTQTLSGLVRMSTVTGSDLEALDRHIRFGAAQAVRVELALRDRSREITTQTEVVSARRRDVRLLEQLQDNKLRQWRQDLFKEVDQQAEDSHRARFSSGRKGESTGEH